MRLQEIIEESTVAGGIATVAMPLGATQSRGPIGQGVYGEKREYANSRPKKQKRRSQQPIKENYSQDKIEIPGSDKMSDDDRHREIMKKYPGAKKTGKTPGIYTLPNGTNLVSGIRGVRKVEEDYSQDEYDEEGEMAKSQASTIADAAHELQRMLDDAENLPEWVQKKITLAQEYIDTARDYLKANRPQSSTIAQD